MSTFLKPIISHLKEAFNQFWVQFSDVGSINSYFYSKGWPSNLDETSLGTVNTIINIESSIEDVLTIVKKIENASEPLESAIADIIPVIKSCIEDIKNLSTISASLANPFPLNQSEFWTELGENLFDDILITYIEKKQKNLFTFLYFFQIIEYTRITPTDINRIPYNRKNFNWDKLADLFTTPGTLLKTNYNWGEGKTPDYYKLYEVLETIFGNYGLLPKRGLIKENYFNQYFTTYSGNEPIEGLEIKILESWDDETNDYRKISISIIPAPNNSQDQLTGFIAIPEIIGYSELNIPLSDDLYLLGKGYFQSDNFIYFKTSPESSSVYTNPLSSTTTIGGKISLVYAPLLPLELLGQRDSSCLMFNGAELSLEIRGSLTDPELVFNLGLGDIIKNANFLFAYEPGEGDGFIQKILGKKQFSSEFGLGLRWSSKSGIQFIGSGGLEIEIPLHDEKKSEESTSPLKINVLRIGFGIGDGAFKLNAAVDISFKLGPVAGVINDIGASLVLKKKLESEPRGILGGIDFDWHFKAPKGIGLSIKEKKLTGYGYLYIDPEKGRYVGGMEIDLAETFHLTAIAIITTKAPDGSKGFSLLAMLNVSFTPSIPFGLGFSLSGIGGLVAINRRMSTEAIRLGVKSGAVNRVVFPENFEKNLLTIIKDLEEFFPVQQARQVFGIFFIIDWGASDAAKILRIKLGIIAEFPGPTRLAIVGTLKLTLPTADAPILVLNVAFAGIIDFEKKFFTFDATIFDSSLLVFSLSGDMAVRVFWGDQKEIVLSVGGFHPAFTPPSFLMLPPKMERLTIMLLDEGMLSLKLTTYFAITSNTAQFGARIDFLLKVLKFRVIGMLGLDVLFQFNPFKMIAQIEAMLAVFWDKRELLSVSIKSSIEGPGPWHAWGTGQFKVLGIKADANFDTTWGAKPKTTLPEIAVKPLIQTELESNSNWRSIIDEGKKETVSIKNLSSELIIHPSGQLAIGQKIAPLGVQLAKYGTQKISDGGLYNITSVKVGGDTQITTSELEQFAPANFRDMSDDQKLKAASFEFLRCGVRLNPSSNSNLYVDSYIVKEVKYDRVIIDKLNTQVDPFIEMSSVLVNDFVSGGMVGDNLVGKHMKSEIDKPILNVTARQERYHIVSKDSLDELSVIGAGVPSTLSGSLADVNTLLENILKTKPGLAGKIQAVPVY